MAAMLLACRSFGYCYDAEKGGWHWDGAPAEIVILTLTLVGIGVLIQITRRRK